MLISGYGNIKKYLKEKKKSNGKIVPSLCPKTSVSALKTHKGQTLAEVAPVKSNMLFYYAERGKGE